MALIIGSAFKIASSVGVAGVSVVSVPVTISVVGSSKANSLFDPLKQEAGKIQTLVTSSMGGLDSALETEYSKFGKEVESGYREYLSKNLNTLQAIGPLAQTSKELLKTYGESINYYAFELGTIAKEVLKTVPTIMRDSALEATSEGKTQNLLSMQKIMMMAKSDKLSSFLSGVMTAMAQHQSLISKLSSQDAQGVIQILRELPKNDISTFLESVGENSSKLDPNSGNYCSPTKLILHLFVGKEKIEGIAASIKQLETLLKDLKDAITQQIDGIDENTIEELKKQLTEISDKQAIKDPCVGATQ